MQRRKEEMNAGDRRAPLPKLEVECRRQPPELFQVVIECRDETEQRELFERMRAAGRKVRLLVL